MNDRIKESDWKIFGQLLPLARERFCQRILDEIALAMAEAERSSDERFAAVYTLVHQRNKDLRDIFSDFRRSTALWQLLCIQRAGLLSEEEFARFSDEAREFVHRLSQPLE